MWSYSGQGQTRVQRHAPGICKVNIARNASVTVVAASFLRELVQKHCGGLLFGAHWAFKQSLVWRACEAYIRLCISWFFDDLAPLFQLPTGQAGDHLVLPSLFTRLAYICIRFEGAGADNTVASGAHARTAIVG